MVKIVLQPYKLREKKFVALEDNPIELDWESYKKLLAPSNSKNSLMVLRKARVGNYVGLLSKQNSTPMNFIFISPNNSKDAKQLFVQLPDIEDRLECLYRVEFVDFGSRVTTKI